MARSSTSRLLQGLLVILIAAGGFRAETGFANPAPDRDLSAFEGDWRLIDRDHDDLARLDAIDRAIDSLPWIYRAMAAPVLRKTTVPPPRIQFFWEGQRLHQKTWGRGNEPARRVDPGAAPIDAKDSRGVPFRSTWTWTESGLQQRWEQHQAFGDNTYRIDSESGKLVVQHTIQVTAISGMQPIVYESTFSRSELPAVSMGLDTIESGNVR